MSTPCLYNHLVWKGFWIFFLVQSKWGWGGSVGWGACVKNGLSGTSVCPAHEQMSICKYLRCPQMHGCGPTSPFFLRQVRKNQPKRRSLYVLSSAGSPLASLSQQHWVLSDSHNQRKITALPLSSVWNCTSVCRAGTVKSLTAKVDTYLQKVKQTKTASNMPSSFLLRRLLLRKVSFISCLGQNYSFHFKHKATRLLSSQRAALPFTRVPPKLLKSKSAWWRGKNCTHWVLMGRDSNIYRMLMWMKKKLPGAKGEALQNWLFAKHG